MATSPQRDGPIHFWFDLSYSNYLVLQRSMLQEMPQEWQERFVKCLKELWEVFDEEQIPTQFWIRATDGKVFVRDPYADYRHGPSPPRRKKG